MSADFPRTFSPFTLGQLKLKNRIVMAPLTCQNAEYDGTPTDEMVGYYARRAAGGVAMIISEGTYPTDELGCVAYLSQPGIVTPGHVEGWRRVADAVHAHGVPIILQLMHGGRVSDPRCLHEGESPVSASAMQSPGWVLYTDTDEEKHNRGLKGEWPKVTFPAARELTVDEIERVAEGFAAGAKRAVEAGCDGVEIHGANSYLYYQFIHPKTNTRKDEYGGSATCARSSWPAARSARRSAPARSSRFGSARTASTISPAPGPAGSPTRARSARRWPTATATRCTGRASTGPITAIRSPTCRWQRRLPKPAASR